MKEGDAEAAGEPNIERKKRQGFRVSADLPITVRLLSSTPRKSSQ